jgi:hypothetical protein
MNARTVHATRAASAAADAIGNPADSLSPAGGQPAEHERHTRIAESAYFLSQARGFVPGRELDDWLTAEREVDAQHAGTAA